MITINNLQTDVEQLEQSLDEARKQKASAIERWKEATEHTAEIKNELEETKGREDVLKRMNGQLDAQRKEREIDQQRLARDKAKLETDLQTIKSDKETTEKNLAIKVDEIGGYRGANPHSSRRVQTMHREREIHNRKSHGGVTAKDRASGKR